MERKKYHSIKKVCTFCGKEFEVINNKRGLNRRMCSKECRYLYLSKLFKDRTFSKEWRTKISLASSNKPKSEEHKENLRKAKKIYLDKRKKNRLYDPIFPYHCDNLWDFNKKLALERDCYRCCHCGTTKNLDVHHIIPYRKSRNNALENLVTLCKSCHGKAEEAKNPHTEDKICGVILAGGKGTRLLPFTKFLNKHELPVGRSPMIFHALNTLRELRVTDIMVILDSEKPGNLIELLKDGKEFGVKICYKAQLGPGGIAEALLEAEDFVGDRNCFVILGDNIFQMKEFHNYPTFYTKGLIFVKEVQNPELYGVPTIKENRVIEVEEKPKFPKSKYAIVGLYAYKPEVFKILKTLEPSKRDELEISDLNDLLAKENELSFREINGYWFDVGNSISSYIEANYFLLKNLLEDEN